MKIEESTRHKSVKKSYILFPSEPYTDSATGVQSLVTARETMYAPPTVPENVFALNGFRLEPIEYDPV